MLDRVFVVGLIVVLVGWVAGVTYQYGHAQGELAALKVQHRAIPLTEKAPQQPKPDVQPEQATGPTREHVQRNNAAILERLYAEQAVRNAARNAQRARELQEQADQLANQYRQALLASNLMALEQQALQKLQQRNQELILRTQQPARSPRSPSRSSYRSKSIDYSKTLYVNLCPPGQRLIAATCLPANSIILGQAPIPVQIVNPIQRLDRIVTKQPRTRRIPRSDPRQEWQPAEQPAWNYSTPGLPVPQPLTGQLPGRIRSP